MKTVIRAARAVLPGETRFTQVIAEKGRILAIEDHFDPDPGDRVINAEGMWLCPGFVDIHVHGGGGYSANSGSADDVLKMAWAHAQMGTTSILPTTLAAPIPELTKAINGIRRAAQAADEGPSILGVHLEGPCLNPLQSGAQAPGSLAVPAETDLSPLKAYA